MNKTDFSFTSEDGRPERHVACFLPEGDVRAVVQLVYDAEETALRYRGLASFLTKHGFAVAGYDLVNGAVTLPEACRDTDAIAGLRGQLSERFPETPLFLAGFGEGSYFLRAYLITRGDRLHGAVLAGTGFVSPRKSTLQKLSHRMGNLFGSSGTQDHTGKLLQAMQVSCSETQIEKLPKDLPVFLVSGAEDDSGDRGAGVRRVQERMLLAGMNDISCKLYPDIGHDLLDSRIAETFFDDLRSFLAAHLDEAHTSSYDSNADYAAKKAAAQKDYEIEQIMI